MPRHDDAPRRDGTTQAFGDLDAVETGHLQIEQADVRSSFSASATACSPAAHSATTSMRPQPQQRRQRRTDHRLVIGEQHTDHAETRFARGVWHRGDEVELLAVLQLHVAAGLGHAASVRQPGSGSAEASDAASLAVILRTATTRRPAPARAGPTCAVPLQHIGRRLADDPSQHGCRRLGRIGRHRGIRRRSRCPRQIHGVGDLIGQRHAAEAHREVSRALPCLGHAGRASRSCSSAASGSPFPEAVARRVRAAGRSPADDAPADQGHPRGPAGVPHSAPRRASDTRARSSVTNTTLITHSQRHHYRQRDGEEAEQPPSVHGLDHVCDHVCQLMNQRAAMMTIDSRTSRRRMLRGQFSVSDGRAAESADEPESAEYPAQQPNMRWRWAALTRHPMNGPAVCHHGGTASAAGCSPRTR